VTDERLNLYEALGLLLGSEALPYAGAVQYLEAAAAPLLESGWLFDTCSGVSTPPLKIEAHLRSYRTRFFGPLGEGCASLPACSLVSFPLRHRPPIIWPFSDKIFFPGFA